MFFLTYVNTTGRDPSKFDLNELPAQCPKNKAELGVTGMLLYMEGNFMQVLEGEESKVRSLYAKIGSDPRYKEGIAEQGIAEERQFPNWSMGYRNPDSGEARSVPVYSEFPDTP